MPTILRLGALRVVICPNDHRPVHVLGPDGEAVFVLNCPDGPPSLREVHGFSRQDVARTGAELAAHDAALCSKGSEMHDLV